MGGEIAFGILIGVTAAKVTQLIKGRLKRRFTVAVRAILEDTNT